jgi:hypothetical protein
VLSELTTKLQSLFSHRPVLQYSAEDIERARALFAMPHISEEARERKYRSEAILKAELVPVNLFLPILQPEADLKLRTKEEVAYRTMALLAVAVKGEGLEQPLVEKFIATYDIRDEFTPEERVFIADIDPSLAARAKFCWRYEAAWTLLWALGFVSKLKKPVKICNAGEAMYLVHHRTAAQFMTDGRLRTASEILDQADLIYRYDWAAVYARVHGNPGPAGVDGEITVERHHAMNWLTRYEDAEWDDVRTDT